MELFDSITGIIAWTASCLAVGWSAHWFFHKRKIEKLDAQIRELQLASDQNTEEISQLKDRLSKYETQESEDRAKNETRNDLSGQLHAKFPNDSLRVCLNYMASELTGHDIGHHELAQALKINPADIQTHIQDLLTLGYIEKGIHSQTQHWRISSKGERSLISTGDIDATMQGE